MIIKFDKVNYETWIANNCVSGHDISIHKDMLGDYVAIVEKQLEDGSWEAYEEVFSNFDKAASWCECPAKDNPVVLTSSFGN